MYQLPAPPHLKIMRVVPKKSLLVEFGLVNAYCLFTLAFPQEPVLCVATGSGLQYAKRYP